MLIPLSALIATALCACADDDAIDGATIDAGDESFTDGGQPDAGPLTFEYLAPAGDDWLTLISGEWEIPAGSEEYRCVRLTIPEDTYVSAMKPLIPVGTHHTVLTVDDVPTTEDGIAACGAFDGGEHQLGGSGVGTDPYTFPEGIAIPLRKGQQLVLNLHLFNASEQPLRGTSGILARTTSLADVEHMAEGVLAGTLELEIPPGRVTQRGTCTFTQAQTVVGLLPHMHQLGVHMKVVAKTAGEGELTLFDAPYDFDNQQIHEVDLVELAAGDTVEVECTYENDRNETVTFGDSSLAEMCFAGLFRYPETDSGVVCLQ